ARASGTFRTAAVTRAFTTPLAASSALLIALGGFLLAVLLGLGVGLLRLLVTLHAVTRKGGGGRERKRREHCREHELLHDQPPWSAFLLTTGPACAPADPFARRRHAFSVSSVYVTR